MQLPVTDDSQSGSSFSFANSHSAKASTQLKAPLQLAAIATCSTPIALAILLQTIPELQRVGIELRAPRKKRL